MKPDNKKATLRVPAGVVPSPEPLEVPSVSGYYFGTGSKIQITVEVSSPDVGTAPVFTRIDTGDASFEEVVTALQEFAHRFAHAADKFERFGLRVLDVKPDSPYAGTILPEQGISTREAAAKLLGVTPPAITEARKAALEKLVAGETLDDIFSREPVFWVKGVKLLYIRDIRD